jgi:hypothetical protein
VAQCSAEISALGAENNFLSPFRAKTNRAEWRIGAYRTSQDQFSQLLVHFKADRNPYPFIGK